MKDIHKKWLIALQTSKKQKGKLLERNENLKIENCLEYKNFEYQK